VTPHEQLKQLEWLIGDWIDEGDDAVVQTSTRWSDDKQFILSDFVIRTPQRGSGALRITQRLIRQRGVTPLMYQYGETVIDEPWPDTEVCVIAVMRSVLS
jgi:hypothetical protein